MPLSQVLELGDIVSRPAAEGGIRRVLLQTTVPTKKTGNSGKVPMARPKKKDPPEMDKAGQVREVSYETGGRTWNIDPGSVRFAGLIVSDPESIVRWIFIAKF